MIFHGVSGFRPSYNPGKQKTPYCSFWLTDEARILLISRPYYYYYDYYYNYLSVGNRIKSTSLFQCLLMNSYFICIYNLESNVMKISNFNFSHYFNSFFPNSFTRLYNLHLYLLTIYIYVSIPPMITLTHKSMINYIQSQPISKIFRSFIFWDRFVADQISSALSTSHSLVELNYFYPFIIQLISIQWIRVVPCVSSQSRHEHRLSLTDSKRRRFEGSSSTYVYLCERIICAISAFGRAPSGFILKTQKGPRSFLSLSLSLFSSRI